MSWRTHALPRLAVRDNRAEALTTEYLVNAKRVSHRKQAARRIAPCSRRSAHLKSRQAHYLTGSAIYAICVDASLERIRVEVFVKFGSGGCLLRDRHSATPEFAGAGAQALRKR